MSQWTQNTAEVDPQLAFATDVTQDARPGGRLFGQRRAAADVPRITRCVGSVTDGGLTLCAICSCNIIIAR